MSGKVWRIAALFLYLDRVEAGGKRGEGIFMILSYAIATL